MTGPTTLLTLPPELLLLSLSYLDTRSLLSFSATSRHSYSLALSSFHTLSLNIHPTRLSSIVNAADAANLPIVTSAASAFAPRDAKAANNLQAEHCSRSFPAERTVSLLPPSAKNIDMPYLTAFAAALSSAVLARYRYSLRKLDLSLWTLDSSTAKSLAGLRSLRVLSLRVRDAYCLYEERMKLVWRQEERRAWRILENEASWEGLSALRLENVQIETEQLITLLHGKDDNATYYRGGGGKGIRELWLRSCYQLDRDIWRSLAKEEKLRNGLEILAIDHSGGPLDEELREDIAEFKALKFLSLSGARGVPTETLEEWNSKDWHISQVDLPQKPLTGAYPEVIEVDPAYL